MREDCTVVDCTFVHCTVYKCTVYNCTAILQVYDERRLMIRKKHSDTSRQHLLAGLKGSVHLQYTYSVHVHIHYTVHVHI